MKISTSSLVHSSAFVSSQVEKASCLLVQHGKDSIEDSGKSKDCLSSIKDIFSFIRDKIIAFFNFITCNLCSAKGPKFSIEVRKINENLISVEDTYVFTFKSDDKEFKIGQLEPIINRTAYFDEYNFRSSLNENEMDLIDEAVMNQLMKKILASTKDPGQNIIVYFDLKLGNLIDESLFENMKKTEQKDGSSYKTIRINRDPI